MTGCKNELDNFCKEVTAGEGLVLARIHAHNDKISGRYEYALYDSAQQLNNALAEFAYLATECDTDIEKYCSNVEQREDRIIARMEP